MKKPLLIVLTLAMLLSLCACGGENDAPKVETSTEPENSSEVITEETEMTKEELLANALSATVEELQTAVYGNKVKAIQTYCNIPISVSGEAIIVEEDHVVICDSQVCLDAYLSIDDLVKIETGNKITVVGIISDIQDIEITWGGVPFTTPHYIMELGYLVD